MLEHLLKLVMPVLEIVQLVIFPNHLDVKNVHSVVKVVKETNSIVLNAEVIVRTLLYVIVKMDILMMDKMIIVRNV